MLFLNIILALCRRVCVFHCPRASPDATIRCCVCLSCLIAFVYVVADRMTWHGRRTHTSTEEHMEHTEHMYEHIRAYTSPYAHICRSDCVAVLSAYICSRRSCLSKGEYQIKIALDATGCNTKAATQRLQYERCYRRAMKYSVYSARLAITCSHRVPTTF